MRKLIALGLTLGILLVAGTLWVTAGRDSQATPQQADTNVAATNEEEFPRLTQQTEFLYDKDAGNVSTQTAHSDIVVVGKVVKIDPARWNSPDGKYWIPPDPVVPWLFRTFWVEPTEVLKGSPTDSGPIPFFLVDGVEGVADGPVDVGETVLVFGYESEQNTATDGYWPIGYKPNVGEYSIYKPDGDRFINGDRDPLVGITTLDQVRQLVASEK